MLPYPVEKIQNVLHQNTQNLLNASMLEKVCEGVLIKNFLLVKIQIISSNTATRYLRLCVCFQCCFYVTYMHESQILRPNIIALCVYFYEMITFILLLLQWSYGKEKQENI